MGIRRFRKRKKIHKKMRNLILIFYFKLFILYLFFWLLPQNAVQNYTLFFIRQTFHTFFLCLSQNFYNQPLSFLNIGPFLIFSVNTSTKRNSCTPTLPEMISYIHTVTGMPYFFLIIFYCHTYRKSIPNTTGNTHYHDSCYSPISI